MHKRLSGISQPVVGYILIALLLAGSAAAYAWNLTVQQAEPRVFYDAIRLSLTSPGVACEISKESNGGSSKQRIVLDLTSRTDASSMTELSEGDAKVVTEGIATKTDDYVKYVSIKAPGKNADGKPHDFSKILNVWGKQSRADLGGNSLFDQAAFGGCVVPLADLPNDKADALMAEVEQGTVYKTDLGRVERTNVNGRPVYAYNVTLTGPTYIKFMKKVAAAAGVKSLDKIDEEAYAERTPEKLKFMINRNNHKLEQVVYNDRTQKVTFSDYGKRPDITVPAGTISTVELQKRLEAVK